MLFPSDYTKGQESARSEGTLTKANLLAIDKGSLKSGEIPESAELSQLKIIKNWVGVFRQEICDLTFELNTGQLLENVSLNAQKEASYILIFKRS